MNRNKKCQWYGTTSSLRQLSLYLLKETGVGVIADQNTPSIESFSLGLQWCDVGPHCHGGFLAESNYHHRAKRQRLVNTHGCNDGHGERLLTLLTSVLCK